jgi:hypothetical protein
MPLSYQDCRVLFVCDGRALTRAQQSFQTRGRGSSEREFRRDMGIVRDALAVNCVRF